eukprot:Platyproteum_vivax@DN7356_c0_g3_i2.p1
MKLHICVLLSLVGAAVGAGAKKGTTIDSLTAMAAPTSEQKVFCCPNCDKTYSRSADVIRHCKKTHGMANEKSKKQSSVQHACSCSKGFSTKRELTKHANEHDHKLLRDERNWEYKCEDCDMKKTSLSSLNLHLQSDEHQKKSDGDKTKAVLWCHECKINFKSERDAAKHLITNPKHQITVKSAVIQKKNFRCKLCNRTFGARWNLTAHIQGSHHDEPQSMNCEEDGCGETFAKEIDLWKHLQDKEHGPFNRAHTSQSKPPRSYGDHYMELTGETSTEKTELIALTAHEGQFLLRREIEEKIAEHEKQEVPDFKRQDKRVLTTLLNKNVPKYSTPDMRWT